MGTCELGKFLPAIQPNPAQLAQSPVDRVNFRRNDGRVGTFCCYDELAQFSFRRRYSGVGLGHRGHREDRQQKSRGSRALGVEIPQGQADDGTLA